MSDITVNVTSAGAANVTVSNGSTVNTTVGNGGAVNVAIGGVSPGNATVVSGTLTINSTTTLDAGVPAYAKNVGTLFAAKLDLGIPAGPATLVGVGNTTTLAAGSNATVNGTLSGSNLTLAFGIPVGANGINGVTPAFAIGNVTTGAAGSSALVTATTTNSGANVTLDLTIPRGDPGTSGTNGTNGTVITLSDGTPANLGTAAPGTSNLSARADHVHSLPVIAYANLSGVPTNFPTNTTLVSGLSAGYSGINHGHNYVTSLNNLTGALTLAAGSNVTLATNGSTLTLSSVGGLGVNDVIDGGDFVGEIVLGITFTTQPQSTTASSSLSLGNWTQQTLSSSNIRSNIAYGNGAFVATSYSANGTRSTDGVTWADVSVSAGNASLGGWASLTYGGGQFVAVGAADAGNSISYASTSDDGSTWALRTITQTSGVGFTAVAYGNGVYAAVGAAGRAASSLDGVNWTLRTLPAVNYFSVAYGDGVFVATSGSSVVARSTNGAAWTSQSILPSQSGLLWRVAYGNGLFVAVSRSTAGAGSIIGATSADGITWTERAMPASSRWSSITYGGGLFTAVAGDGDDTTDVATSVDGISWTLGALPVTSQWSGVAYGGNSFVAVSSSNGLLAASLSPTLVTGSANFTVAATASGGGTVSYQWQSSIDAGGTWANVSNATATSLNLSGLTTADSGKRYRAAASATGATTAFSQSATLTVTG
jgi:hypothetical protein